MSLVEQGLVILPGQLCSTPVLGTGNPPWAAMSLVEQGLVILPGQLCVEQGLVILPG
jgi:hypothetical protein